MSTRCAIYVPEGEWKMRRYYHHSDGYPTGVGVAAWEACLRGNKNGAFFLLPTESTLKRCLKKSPLRSGDGLEKEGLVLEAVLWEMFEEGGRYDNTSLDHHEDIEWRYRIQRDGSLRVDSINSGKSYHITSEEEMTALTDAYEKAQTDEDIDEGP
jgi:hypothetical protein